MYSINVKKLERAILERKHAELGLAPPERSGEPSRKVASPEAKCLTRKAQRRARKITQRNQKH